MANEPHTSRRRGSVLRVSGLAIALLLTVGIGWRQTHQSEPAPKFCTAEGYLMLDGRLLGHDSYNDCAWVDQDGNLVSPPPS